MSGRGVWRAWYPPMLKKHTALVRKLKEIDERQGRKARCDPALLIRARILEKESLEVGRSHEDDA